MKKMLIGVATAATLAAAGLPAAAAPGDNINARQAQVERQIDRGERQDRLGRREAMQLRIHLREIERIERRYRVNGLSRAERFELTQRLDRLAWRVTAQLNDGDRYAHGYGRR